jgi:hypothetical protein
VSSPDDRLSAPRIVRHSGDLLRVISDRINALETTHACVEEISGLQLGYISKIVGPDPPKRLSTWTSFLLLEALGLQVTVSLDPRFAERFADRFEKRKVVKAVRKQAGIFGRQALEAMPPDMRLVRNRRGGRNRMRQMTPAERSAFGRAAANSRWSRARKGHVVCRFGGPLT